MTRITQQILLLCLSGCWPAAMGLNGTSAEEPEWRMLFDGSSLAGWRGYGSEQLPAGWQIEEGALSRVDGGGDIMTVEQFGDFELTLEWKISPGGNSGIMYRVSTGDAAPYISGPEYQILDNEGAHDDKDASTSAGALYGLYATDTSAAKPAGEWNTAKIVLHGNHLEHWLNGTKVVDCEMHGDDWKQRVAASKFAAWERFGQNASGHIALQDHGNPVWYRNIKVRSL